MRNVRIPANRQIKSMEDINLTKDKNELVKAFFQKLKGLEPTQLVHVAHQLEFQNVTYAVLDAHELSKTRQVSRPTQTQLVAVRDRLEVVSPQRTVSPLEPASEVKVNKETQTDEVSDYVKLKNIQDVTYHFPEVSPLALVTPKTPASRPHKSSGQPSSTPTTPSHSRTQARIRSQSANEP